MSGAARLGLTAFHWPLTAPRISSLAFFLTSASFFSFLSPLPPPSSDWCEFKEMTEVIVGVSLVRAKPGIVSASVEYMLVIATPIMVYLVGVEFRRGADGLPDRREMNLHRQTLFSTSTDNVRPLAFLLFGAAVF